MLIYHILECHWPMSKLKLFSNGYVISWAIPVFNSQPAYQRQINDEVSTTLPTIYGITPTYARLTQKADLTR